MKDRRAAYFTEKLVEPNAAKAPDDMGIIDFAETDGAIAGGEATYTARGSTPAGSRACWRASLRGCRPPTPP